MATALSIEVVAVPGSLGTLSTTADATVNDLVSMVATRAGQSDLIEGGDAWYDYSFVLRLPGGSAVILDHTKPGARAVREALAKTLGELGGVLKVNIIAHGYRATVMPADFEAGESMLNCYSRLAPAFSALDSNNSLPLQARGQAR